MSQSSTNPIAEMAKGAQIENLFPTPMFSFVLKNVEALNVQLRELILERERTTPSMAKSNLGGWQSQVDFFTWNNPASAALERLMRSSVDIATTRLPLVAPNVKFQFELVGWAAVNRNGHYNASHVHPLATWSGVYYVDPGDEPANGPAAYLELEHPIQTSVMTFFPGFLPSTLIVRPEAGLVVMFPSYLVHSVRIYRGERPRICVAFNAHLRLGS